MNSTIEVEECFEKIHGKLWQIPDKYCYWRKESSVGSKISKSLSSDYRPLFNFVKDTELRNNLGELRMCLDYHRSIYELLKPVGTFSWQHKLVICQLVASIYEGLFFDLYFHRLEQGSNNTLCKTVVTNRKQKEVGLGYLLDVFNKSGFFKDEKWKKYLDDLNHLRNTIHPKSLNTALTSYENNEVIKKTAGETIDKLDDFIKLIQKVY